MSTPLTSTDSATSPDDSFAAWLDRASARPRVGGRRPCEPEGGLRFAFAGRISTDGYQDQVSSRQWQYDNADRLVTGHGVIVVSFFDVGYSRSLPWHLRPEAAALLAEASRPDRWFDAVVVGEFERASAGTVIAVSQWPAGQRPPP